MWPVPVCGVLDVAFLAVLTRGLHLDGVADTFDAVGSGMPRDRALEIMRDSSSGALGVLAMVLVLMLKAVALVQLSAHAAWNWFMLVPCLSRFAINLLGSFSGYARKGGGLGEAFTGRKAMRYMPVALLTVLSAAWILGGASGLSMTGVLAACSLTAAWWMRCRFGGVTGDLLGAHLEITETAMFLWAAAILA